MRTKDCHGCRQGLEIVWEETLYTGGGCVQHIATATTLGRQATQTEAWRTKGWAGHSGLAGHVERGMVDGLGEGL